MIDNNKNAITSPAEEMFTCGWATCLLTDRGRCRLDTSYVECVERRSREHRLLVLRVRRRRTALLRRREFTPQRRLCKRLALYMT